MANPLTKDDLLAVVDRVLPDSYLDPIKTIGPGYELIQGFAAIGERCSLAVSRFEDDGLILSAAGGRLATVEVVFYRETAAAGAGAVLADTIVRASKGGRVFRTATDAVFGASDLEATATAIASGYGYEWNVKGQFIDPDGDVWPGEIDTIDLPLQDPVFWDPSIQVRNDADADGLGRPATLDVLGGERGLPRQVDEGDGNYRVRIRSLPDTVSPAAIRRQLTNFFRRLPGHQWSVIETWTHEYQECFDAPDLPPTAFENYDANLFCFDDPRSPTPIRNRLLGENDHLGAFIVETAMPSAIQEYSFAFDDPADDIEDVTTANGVRAWSALDVPDTLLPPAIAPAFDGEDVGATLLFAELFALLEEIKAGGVFVVIHFTEQE